MPGRGPEGARYGRKHPRDGHTRGRGTQRGPRRTHGPLRRDARSPCCPQPPSSCLCCCWVKRSFYFSAELLRTTRVQMRWALPVTFTGVRRFGRCARRRAGTSCFGWTVDRGVPGGHGVAPRQRPSPPFDSVVCYSQVTRSARDSRPNDGNDGSDWATTVPDWPNRGNKRPERKQKNRETCDFSRQGSQTGVVARFGKCDSGFEREPV